MQINGEKGAIFWCKVYGVKAEPQLFNVMTHTNKMSYFAIFSRVKPSYFAIFFRQNRLILQFL